jgi:hypothetical protein
MKHFEVFSKYTKAKDLGRELIIAWRFCQGSEK